MIALLSWRVVAEVALSEHQAWLDLLRLRQGAGQMLIGQYSLIKASGFVRGRKLNDIGFFDRFTQQFILLQAIVDPFTVTGALYNQLARIAGEEGLELFAIALAIQHKYRYICWNEDDERWSLSLDHRLDVGRFEAMCDGF